MEKTFVTTPPVPAHETARLELIRDIGLVQSGSSPEFDTITELAADLLECPIALISIVEAEDQWFKSSVGLDLSNTPRDQAFCAHTILKSDPLVVRDAREDARFEDNPLVLGDPHIVFYAGVPLSLDGNTNFGSICVIDHKPRDLDATQLARLKKLARMTEALFMTYKAQRESQIAKVQIEKRTEELSRTALLLNQIKELTGVGGWELRLDPPVLTWTGKTKHIHDVPPDYVPDLETAINFYAPEARPVIQNAVTEAMAKGTPYDLVLPLITAKGRKIMVRAIGSPVYEGEKITRLIGACSGCHRAKTSRRAIADLGVDCTRAIRRPPDHSRQYGRRRQRL